MAAQQYFQSDMSERSGGSTSVVVGGCSSLFSRSVGTGEITKGSFRERNVGMVRRRRV